MNTVCLQPGFDLGHLAPSLSVSRHCATGPCFRHFPVKSRASVCASPEMHSHGVCQSAVCSFLFVFFLT